VGAERFLASNVFQYSHCFQMTPISSMFHSAKCKVHSIALKKSQQLVLNQKCLEGLEDYALPITHLVVNSDKSIVWVRKKAPLYSVSVCFRGISRLPSAFVFLRWFKLAHISIQVFTSHDGCKQGIDQQIFNRKSISRKITHPQSLFK